MSARGPDLPQRPPWHWCGALPEGMAVPRPRNPLVQRGAEQRWTRAVWAAATPATAFAWLCQLRVAPYSYDLLDNGGRRSPRARNPELLAVRTGDPVMTIFTTTAVEPGRSIAVRMNPGVATLLFGAIELRYTTIPAGAGVWLLAEMLVPPTPGPFGRVRRTILAWGDFVMMRKQLLVLAHLAAAEDAAT
ncbi:hypothetical protein SRABI02_01730 [Plantibacter cousiniae]|nr:hypothetical protein SRABI02_01730 [Plantibacter cousiniae]